MIINKNSGIYSLWLKIVIFVIAIISFDPVRAAGSGPVTNLVTSTQDAGADITYVSNNGQTHTWGAGNNIVLDSFDHNGRNYSAGDAIGPNQIVLRRDDNPRSSGERCRVFAETVGSGSGNARTMQPTFPSGGPTGCSMESVLGGNVINMGTLDLFSNADSEGVNNIERVDYIVTAGVDIPNVANITQTMGIMASEKSGNNAFQVAAITSLDGSGNPSGFGPLVRINTANSGQPIRYGLTGNPQTCNQFLQDEANAPQSGLLAGSRSSCFSETLGSVFVSLDDMGVSQGNTIFGYAWFPLDVSNADNLVDWTTFPDNTGNGSGSNNGIDAGADIYGGLVGIFVPNLPEAVDDIIDGSGLTMPGDMLNINPLIDNGNGADSFGGDGPGTTPIFLIDPVTGNTVSGIVTPNGGTVTVNDGGTPGDPTDDTFDYTAPNTGNATLTETFEYQICDLDGPPECDTATVTFSVQTPVTLSAVASEWAGDRLKVDWSTSSELFNVGFQLWGLDAVDEKWEKLHNWLLRSGAGNAVEAQSYSKSVRVPGSIDELVALGISSVDSDGAEHYYGPFEVGRAYGNLSQLKPIAWDHIRAQTDAQMAARGYVKDRVHGYRNVSGAAGDTDTVSVVEFNIRETGVYRISAQALLNAGVDWTAVLKREIALLDHRGNAIVRYVAAKGAGSGQSKTLGAGGEIYFHANGVDGEAGLYTESSVYRLVIDRHRALDAQYQGKRGLSGGYSAYYRASTVLERDNQYSLTSAADDPWLDAVVLSYADQTGSYAAALEVEADALWQHDAVLTLNLARSSGLAPVDGNGDGTQDPEHLLEAVVLSPDGTGGLLPLGTTEAVGSGPWTPAFTIPANTPLTLIDGKTVVGGVFRAGTGYHLSEVQVDSVALSYARPYMAKAGDNHLSFTGPDDGAPGYEVTVPETGWPLVFAHAKGNLVRLALESQLKQTTLAGERQRMVRFAALDGVNSAVPVDYWVSGKGGFMTVEGLSAKTILSRASLLTQSAGAQLLLIAHPAFMGEALSGYADVKRVQGYRVAIIDYLQVVDTFGGGQPGPVGLTNYLGQVNAGGHLDHVLLVGGSSYDHTDRLQTGAMTFIPGHYGESVYSRYTVSDTPYVIDDDQRLFASIGRWPVRTALDLSTIIANSIAWSRRDHDQGSALMIAEHTVAGEGIDFGAALDNHLGPLVPASRSVNRVYVDTILRDNPGYTLTQALAEGKRQIIDGLNANPDVVLYNGHATTSQLSNKGLFQAADVSQVTGQGGQLWFPMSCYMTYYESTHVNTLAYQLLFRGPAVGISGAMLLSNQAENISAGRALLEGTINRGQSIGEAVNAHKVHASHSQRINLSHLGDPTLRM